MEEMKEPTSAEIMQERGFFTANGYTFSVEPIYVEEEPEFRNDVPWVLYPRNKDGTPKENPSAKDLSLHLIRLFNYVDEKQSKKEKVGLFERIKLWLVKHTKYRYEYYSDNPTALSIAKWVSKKVKYKGKHIKFQDLERKYKLTKSEIVELLGYLESMSFFG